jgi:hypothetical protein
MYIFKYEKNRNCFTINIDDKEIFIDIMDLEKIYNFSNNKDNIKWYIDNKYLYTKDINGNNIYFLEKIFNVKFESNEWIFKNGNMYDLRRNNIKYKLIETIEFSKWEFAKDYEVLKEYVGHKPTMGRKAGQILNPYWNVKHKITGEKIYVMYCIPDTYCLIAEKNIDDVLKIDKDNINPTWYKMDVGYVATHLKNSDTKLLYMHQHLLRKELKDKWDDSKTVDHINRNKVDNRIENLRLATQSEQNSNTDKRNRKHNARDLPAGISQSDLPKFITYNKETVNKQTGKTREFFRVEKHIKQDGKKWSTSKSDKISIHDKLKQAIKYLDTLNN